MRPFLSRPARLLILTMIVATACGPNGAAPLSSTVTTSPAVPTSTSPASPGLPLSSPPVDDQPPVTEYQRRFYFATIPPGGELPDGDDCASRILSDEPSSGPVEVRPENGEANATTVDVTVDIDGADERWNIELATRITGDFTGTTDQILRWGACKWGFDEDVTRARAVAESSWRVGTEGDVTGDPSACELIERSTPCPQSFGLLQVKGTVHDGTYPATTESTAFGVDYAMAWLRACYEGSFTWLGNGYETYGAGDELGCVGAWFSGNWWDQPANDYVGEVRYHLQQRTWETYGS